MRAPFLAFAVLAAAAAGFASNASAQQAAHSATQYMSEKDVMALIEKAKADRKGEAPMVAEPILLLAPLQGAARIPAVEGAGGRARKKPPALRRAAGHRRHHRRRQAGQREAGGRN